MAARENSFSLISMNQARGLVACMLSADVALALLYLFLFLQGNPIGNDRPGMFDMDGEGNIPSWYSSIKLLAVALCAYFYGRLVLHKDKWAGALVLVGAALFAYLSMDEGATLHEKIGARFDMLLSGGAGGVKPVFETTGVWMLFLGPPLFLALVGGVFYLRKRLSIPAGVFAKAVAGILLFVIAAAPGDILVNYFTGDALVIQTAVEELSEMLGVTLVLWAAMSLLALQEPIVVGRALAFGVPRATAERDPASSGEPVVRGGGAALPMPARAHRQPS